MSNENPVVMKSTQKNIELVDAAGKVSLIGRTMEELESFLGKLDQPSYRGRQVYEWIYAKRTKSFGEMTSLPASLREQLEGVGTLRTLSVLDTQKSVDGTIKFLFRTHDDLNIEAVLIPSEARTSDGEPKRKTLCLSSQVGCPLDCKFCATGSMKLKRNLSASEIIEQYLYVEELVGEKVTNIVYMGMGEPMLNYDEVFRSVDLFVDPNNSLVPASRITVSTSGLVPEIRRMADEGKRIKLAISLHHTVNERRSELMPINRKYNINALLESVEYYYRKARRPVTYEYILFKDFNDSREDATRLARIARRVPSKVNVIPFHPIDFTNPTGIGSRLQTPSPTAFNSFVSTMRGFGIPIMVRSSSGVDIDAACGQLAIKHDDVRL